MGLTFVFNGFEIDSQYGRPSSRRYWIFFFSTLRERSPWVLEILFAQLYFVPFASCVSLLRKISLVFLKQPPSHPCCVLPLCREEKKKRRLLIVFRRSVKKSQTTRRWEEVAREKASILTLEEQENSQVADGSFDVFRLSVCAPCPSLNPAGYNIVSTVCLLRCGFPFDSLELEKFHFIEAIHKEGGDCHIGSRYSFCLRWENEGINKWHLGSRREEQKERREGKKGSSSSSRNSKREEDHEGNPNNTRRTFYVRLKIPVLFSQLSLTRCILCIARSSRARRKISCLRSLKVATQCLGACQPRPKRFIIRNRLSTQYSKV